MNIFLKKRYVRGKYELNFFVSAQILGTFVTHDNMCGAIFVGKIGKT